MFELNNEQSWVETTAEDVVDIYTSINRSTVQPPDRVPEQAQAFIATVYKDGAYQVYIYLYLASSNVGLLYCWSEGGVPADTVNTLYSNALQFTESMGFMMDDMRYRDKNPEEKAQAFAEVPMFHSDLSFMKSEEPEGEEAVEDLVIEPLDEEGEVEAVEEEAEEINLAVLGEDDDVTPPEPEEISVEAEEVTELTIDGEEVTEEPMVLQVEAEESAAPPSPEEASPEEMVVEEVVQEPQEETPPAAEPAAEPSQDEAVDTLFDALEIKEEGAGPQTATEETIESAEAIEEILPVPGADEQTIEAAPLAEAVVESSPDDQEPAEEPPLTPEEAQVLGGLEEVEAASPEIEDEVEVEDIFIKEETPEQEAEPAEQGQAPEEAVTGPEEEEREVEAQPGQVAPISSPEAPAIEDVEVEAEVPDEEVVTLGAEPEPAVVESEPVETVEVAEDASAQQVPGGEASTEGPVSEQELSAEDYETLVRLLAMM